MSRKSIVQKSKSHLNTNQNVVNRMAEKNFEIDTTKMNVTRYAAYRKQLHLYVDNDGDKI